jgi:hypothetical protein
LRNFNRADETVTVARDCLDKAWFLGIIAQCCSNLVDGEVDAAFEIDKGVVSPDVLVNFFAGDDLSSAFYEQEKNSELLPLELDHTAALAQLAIGGIEFEGAEADCA